MKTLADRIITFNKNLDFKGVLPLNIRIMNPFKENGDALSTSSAVYKKYFNDQCKRHLVLGINPGRFGAGITGVPFTDPKRIIDKCGIRFRGELKHEPSSVFIYDMIDAFGGAEIFYRHFYINSVCPLGFTTLTGKGRDVNFNYYDDKELSQLMRPFIIENIRKQIGLGMNTGTVFCLGTGKNEKYLRDLNKEFHFFDNIVALEHPRFIMQYRSADKTFYLDKYITAFKRVLEER